MPSKNSIFISYRRSDSSDVVGRINDRLREHFGPDVVFKDVESIPYGDNFRAHLVQTVGQCQVVIAVIGTSWLLALQERLTRGEHDWVRTEIETALNRAIAIPVIPLLVSGANMPSAAALPEGLKSLAHRNAAHARRDPDFHGDLNRLIQRLEDIVGVPEPQLGAQADSDSIQPASVAAAITEPNRPSPQSFSIGSISVSGSNNPVNAIQASGDVAIHQNAQSTAPGSRSQAALVAVEALKQAIAASGEVDETETEMVAIPLQKLEAELHKPQPDDRIVEKAIATIAKMLAGVETVSAAVDRVATLAITA